MRSRIHHGVMDAARRRGPGAVTEEVAMDTMKGSTMNEFAMAELVMNEHITAKPRASGSAAGLSIGGPGETGLRGRGHAQSIVYTVGECPDSQGPAGRLGTALVARSGLGVCAHPARRREGVAGGRACALLPGGEAAGDPRPRCKRRPRRLVDIPARCRRRAFDHPLDVAGTPLQQQVWDVLRGSQLARTDLHRACGPGRQADAVRAVASACAANRLAVVIPCHRVVGRSGSLTGYRWGVDRKRQLLEMESAG